MKIVVLSSYRTGSTAFCNALSKMYSIKNYDEYFHRDKTHTDFDTVKSKGYVIKIMPDQIIEPYFTELIQSSLVYGIYRIDVVKQIASYFISIQRNVWHNKHNSDTEKYEISFDPAHVGLVAKQILEFNKDYEEKLRPLCSKEFIYENIQPVLKISDFNRYNKPVNYQELIDTIQILVNKENENIQ